VSADNPFGRPGRRADLARELHEAFCRHGVELLPGRARRMVDERIQQVAEQTRVSERTAVTYLPEGWAEQIAADVALEHEQSQMAERIATGEVEMSASRLGALIAGLAVVVQNNVWRAMDNALPASIGQSLDCLTGLALALQPASFEVPVTRAELLAAARLLGSESDAIASGHATPHDENAKQLESVTERLASDAAWARRLAQ
jgi:hypothetical protein